MDKLINISVISQSANAPNIRRLKLIDIEDVIKINYPNIYNDNSDSLNYTLSQTAIITKLTTKIIQINFISGLASYQENAEFSEAGTSFLNSVTISTKIDNPANTMSVELMLNKGFIALTEDRNGKCKVLGSKKQPVRLTVSALTIGGNERTLTWETRTKNQSFFIQSIKDRDILGGEFSDDFSNDFFI